jgi:hypothetical protein
VWCAALGYRLTQRGHFRVTCPFTGRRGDPPPWATARVGGRSARTSTVSPFLLLVRFGSALHERCAIAFDLGGCSLDGGSAALELSQVFVPRACPIRGRIVV